MSTTSSASFGSVKSTVEVSEPQSPLGPVQDSQTEGDERDSGVDPKNDPPQDPSAENAEEADAIEQQEAVSQPANVTDDRSPSGADDVGVHEHVDADHGSGSLMDHYLGQDHLISHVQDQLYFQLPGGLLEDNIVKLWIPQVSPWSEEEPLVAAPKGAEEFLGPITFQPTKFIIVELIAAVLVATVFIWLGRRIKSGEAPKGRLWNMLEASVVFVRDEIAKPSIGSHDSKRFLPFLLTSFFFILTMNLMGMMPLLGTATGNISITISLALLVFAIVLFSGMKKLGIMGFWTAQAPHIDLPAAMGLPITIGIWAIEVFGLFVKHMVLAVRLFSNMFAGHLVLAVFVGFIGVTWGQWWSVAVFPAAIGGSIAIGLLEILVSLIQAYVFTFLAAMFIGSALHPH